MRSLQRREHAQATPPATIESYSAEHRRRSGDVGVSVGLADRPGNNPRRYSALGKVMAEEAVICEPLSTRGFPEKRESTGNSRVLAGLCAYSGTGVWRNSASPAAEFPKRGTGKSLNRAGSAPNAIRETRLVIRDNNQVGRRKRRRLLTWMGTTGWTDTGSKAPREFVYDCQLAGFQETI
jgi:hypothetical protein